MLQGASTSAARLPEVRESGAPRRRCGSRPGGHCRDCSEHTTAIAACQWALSLHHALRIPFSCSGDPRASDLQTSQPSHIHWRHIHWHVTFRTPTGRGTLAAALSPIGRASRGQLTPA